MGVDCTGNFFRKKAIEKTILRVLRPSAFSHSLDPSATLALHRSTTACRRVVDKLSSGLGMPTFREKRISTSGTSSTAGGEVSQEIVARKKSENRQLSMERLKIKLRAFCEKLG
jgi:hypothetical protein